MWREISIETKRMRSARCAMVCAGMSKASWFRPDLLQGRIAVVTGGGSGIGFEIAAAFLAHGAQVAIMSRNDARLEEAADTLLKRTGARPLTGACDVRDEPSVLAFSQRVTRELGTADIVVNNAAGNFMVPAERMSKKAMTTVLDIDLVGTYTVTRAFVPGMIEIGRGVVLSIVIPEPERGFPGFSHAGAAKAGIVSLTRSWAREWGRYGIRTAAIGPGPVPTEGVARHMFGVSVEEAFRGAAERVPLGRLGSPEDIANAALFLSSDAAAWISGALLAVDGGASAASER
ncbi:MAG: SDR family oxidoreductase [Chloroflexi bacterium]|nr:MAG: SDR family oxidoreductase [Chloroflexota bacterium]